MSDNVQNMHTLPKACPHCGSRQVRVYDDTPSCDVKPSPHVVCQDCLSGSPSIEAWNQRSGVSRWLPISTAPKDSTPVDIWKPRYGRLTDYVRVWLAPDNVFYNPLESGVVCVRDATHWMPIPEPPDEEGQR